MKIRALKFYSDKGVAQGFEISQSKIYSFSRSEMKIFLRYNKQKYYLTTLILKNSSVKIKTRSRYK